MKRLSRNILLLLISLPIGLLSEKAFAATYTVTSTAGDNSVGSLRWAADQANSNAGHDRIVFDASLGANPQINLTTDIYITESVEIDGTTASGGMVQLNGNNGYFDAFLLAMNNRGSSPNQTVIAGFNIRSFQRQGISGSDVENILIDNCIIGTNFNGTSASPNANGISFLNSTDITIGTSTGGNQISGNRESGVYLQDVIDVTIQNNLIGTNAAVTGAIKNGTIDHDGVKINGGSNVLIGGTGVNDGNVISGNHKQGIYAERITDITILGNALGTNKDGSIAIANGQYGIYLEQPIRAIIGNKTGAGNILSSNTEWGMNITNGNDVELHGNEVYDNEKGVNIENTTSVTATNNFFGGSLFEGLHLNTVTTATVQSNIFGLEADGTTLNANAGDGLKLENVSNVLVGGTDPSERNVISASKNGIWAGSGTNDVQIYGNYFGTDVTGMLDRGGSDHVIRIDDATNIDIGGPTDAHRNILSGADGSYGVRIGSEGWWGSNQNNVTIQNNYIGTDVTGNNALGNGGGIYLADQQNRITTPPVVIDNLIAGNTGNGITIENSSLAFEFFNNTIGEAANGTALGNGGHGFQMTNTDNVTIGGTGTNESNIISNNGGSGIFMENGSSSNTVTNNTITNNDNGVRIQDSNSNQNEITENSISCNTTKGINLNGSTANPQGNNQKTTPTIDACSSQGNMIGTSDAGDRIEIYLKGDCFTNGTCSASDYQMQGKTFITSVTANGAGIWTWASTLDPEEYTVVAIASNGNTSEFAICSCTDPTFTASGNDPSCTDDDGQIILDPSGSNPLKPNVDYDISYLFGGSTENVTLTSNGTGQIIIDNLQGGNYTQINASLFNCTSSDANVTLTTEIAPVITVAKTEPGCGTSDGIITISGLDNSTTYDVYYTLSGSTTGPLGLTSNGSGNLEITGLAGGSYSQIYAEAAGCTTNEETIPLISASAPTLSASSTDPSGCTLTDGTITVTGFDPSTSYTISYNDPNPQTTTQTSTAGGAITITGLGAGTYTDIQTTIGPCTTSPLSETLSDPGSPSITTSSVPPTCQGSDGSITISGLDPSENYDVDYILGTGVNSTENSDASGVITLSNLSAGDYTSIQVTINSCASNTSSESLAVPTSPTLASSASQPSGCGFNDGSIIITGLDANVSYDIDYEFNTTPQTATMTSSATGSITISALVEGDYTNIIATDGICVSNSTAQTLTDPTTPSITTDSNDPTCLGSDGDITISGLTAGESYVIDYLLDGTPTGTTQTADGSGNITLSNLDEAVYSDITATINSCTSNTSTETLTAPVPPSITSSSSDVTCAGADGQIILSGLITNETYAVSYDPGSGLISTDFSADVSGNITVPNLSAATYSNIMVTKDFCESNTRTETIADPTSPTITATDQSPSECLVDDGFIELAGLSPNIEYTIDYLLGSIAVSTTLTASATGVITLDNLGDGVYSNIIATEGICISNPVGTTLSDPSAPVITTSLVEPSCIGNDGTITITGLNNNVSYDVDYTFVGSTTSSTISSSGTGTIVLTGLEPGDYSNISATLDGCTSNFETETLPSPSLADITSSAFNPTMCTSNDGSITLSGLTSSLSFEINYLKDGTAVNTTLSSDASGDITINNLGLGDYTEISATFGICITNEVAEELISPDSPDFTISSADASTCAGTDGSITLSNVAPSGLLANTIYTVSYFNGTSTVSNTLTSNGSAEIVITDLGQGDYSAISVTRNGCTTEKGPIAIAEPDAPTFTLAGANETGCDLRDGAVTIAGLDANTNYNISYNSSLGTQALTATSNASGSIQIPNLAAGNYSQFEVEVLNCVGTANESITITSPSLTTGSSVADNIEFCRDEATDISITGTNATGIAWESFDAESGWETISPSITSNSFNTAGKFNAGEYVFRAMLTLDNCIDYGNTVEIQVDSCPELFIPTAITPNGDFLNEGWNIVGLEEYDQYEVKVYNRYGNLVYKTYAPYTPWDGTRNGKGLPVATYYYVVKVYDTDESFTGPLTIVR